MLFGPAFQKKFQFGIGLIRQHDTQGDVLTTTFADFSGIKTLSFQTQPVSAVCMLGHRHCDRSIDGRDTHFSAEHGLMQRNGQLDVNIIGVPTKQLVWDHMHRDERIAIRSSPDTRHTFRFEPQDLPITQTGRNREIKSTPVRHDNPALGATRSVHEIHFERLADVAAAHPHVLLPARTSTARLAEQIGKDIAPVAEIGVTAYSLIGMVSPGIGIVSVGLLLRTLLSFGIDFTLVETRALVGVTHDSLKRSSASRFPGFKSGWCSLASLR